MALGSASNACRALAAAFFAAAMILDTRTPTCCYGNVVIRNDCSSSSGRKAHHSRMIAQVNVLGSTITTMHSQQRPAPPTRKSDTQRDRTHSSSMERPPERDRVLLQQTPRANYSVHELATFNVPWSTARTVLVRRGSSRYNTGTPTHEEHWGWHQARDGPLQLQLQLAHRLGRSRHLLLLQRQQRLRRRHQQRGRQRREVQAEAAMQSLERSTHQGGTVPHGADRWVGWPSAPPSMAAGCHKWRNAQGKAGCEGCTQRRSTSVRRLSLPSCFQEGHQCCLEHQGQQ